jgi:capsular exopolysaccharide synthesis family protein
MSRVENLANGRRLKPVSAVPARGQEKSLRHPSLDEVDAHLVSLVAPDSSEAEQYRALRYEVEYLHKAGECSVVGVCSALPGDGKTMTAINLAGALAQDPRERVLLIEADLRRPAVTVGDQLGLGDVTGRGLVDAILDPSLSLEEVVRHVPHFNLTALPAGKRAGSPYEALKSPRFGELLTQARQRYDYVVLDAPPVVPVPDCRLIAKWVDGFLMVVAAHRTPREALEEALTLMRPASVLGLVFNGYDRSAKRYYGYYGYGYGSSTGRNRVRWWNRLWGR